MKEQKKQADKKQEGKSNSKSNAPKGGGNNQRDGRRHNRRSDNRRGRPQNQVFKKGVPMSLAFFDEGRNGQVEMIARDGKTPIFPGRLQFEPVPGQIYDLSVLFPDHGRFGKALPAVPSMWIGNGWLTDQQYRAKLRQELQFHWQEKGGKKKFVSRFQGWMVFMDHRDAQDKTEGRYLVQLQEQDSSLLARCLLGNSGRQKRQEKTSGFTLNDVAGKDLVAKIDKLIPTVRRKFAAAAPNATELRDKDIQVRIVNVYEALRIAEDADRREIEEAFRKRKAEIDPKAVLEQLGQAATLNVRKNCEFALEALVECYEKALALLENRQAGLGAISAKPTGGAKLAKAALKAAKGETTAPVTKPSPAESNDDSWDGDVAKLLRQAVDEAYAKPHDFTGLDPKAIVACYQDQEFTAEQVEQARILLNIKDAEVKIKPTAKLFRDFSKSQTATPRDRQVCQVAAEFGAAIPVLAGLIGAKMCGRIGIFYARSVSAKASHQNRRKNKRYQKQN